MPDWADERLKELIGDLERIEQRIDQLVLQVATLQTALEVSKDQHRSQTPIRIAVINGVVALAVALFSLFKS